ncbi:MAG: tetratricopeptide repeat protein [Bacteroidetes bacterium]|nr:tetratricopeptide repeat protein [Bacteroidota bacterium]
MRAAVVILCVLGMLACHSGKVKGRYISEKDTAFSQDIRDISAKINKDPDNAELYYRRGNTFYYQKKYKDALLDLGTAIELDSMNPAYHFLMGESALKMDSADSKLAMKHLQKAVQLKPGFHEASLLLGKLWLARQEYEKAEPLFTTLTTQASEADKGWLYLGICYKEKKDTNRALSAFERSMQANPQNYDAVMQKADLLAARRDELALKLYDRALVINEYSDEVFYAKGLFLQKLNRYEDAIKHYDRARNLNPGHILAHYNSAYIYMLFEDWVKALDMCNRTLDLDAGNANALALRGYVHEKQGDKKSALEDYKSALAKDPENAPAKAGLKAVGG